MKIDVLTLFPEMFNSLLSESLIRKAIQRELIDIRLTDIRDFSTNKHHKVDDAPYGGGKGLVMGAEPIVSAFEAVAKETSSRTIFLSPGGKVLDQKKLVELSAYDQFGKEVTLEQMMIDAGVSNQAQSQLNLFKITVSILVILFLVTLIKMMV